MGMLLDTARRAFDGVIDYRYGISTYGTSEDEFHPSSYRVLHRIFMHLGVTNDDVLADLGCGLGRVVCVGAQYPFRKIRGVELDPETAAQAQKTLRTCARGLSTTLKLLQPMPPHLIAAIPRSSLCTVHFMEKFSAGFWKTLEHL